MINNNNPRYKVAAIVVTYNRLKLLQEGIAALREQTFAVDKIVIVDNGSTDGTGDWLKTQHDLTVVCQDNTGCSGGVHTGIRSVLNTDVDWLWIMDDDTICSKDSLEKLVTTCKTLEEQKIGFIGSKCVWTDGNPHLMNLINIKPYFQGNTPFNKFDNDGVLLTESCSFVSVLVNEKAVREVGLPYKEFFIWNDDLEYTQRITKAGYLGLYCPESVVLHKTASNYRADLYTEPPTAIWKYRYGIRNDFFMAKKAKGLLFFLAWLPARICYTILKIFVIRKDNKFKFANVVLLAGWRSIFFNPTIDRA